MKLSPHTRKIVWIHVFGVWRGMCPLWRTLMSLVCILANELVYLPAMWENPNFGYNNVPICFAFWWFECIGLLVIIRCCRHHYSKRLWQESHRPLLACTAATCHYTVNVRGGDVNSFLFGHQRVSRCRNHLYLLLQMRMMINNLVRVIDGVCRWAYYKSRWLMNEEGNVLKSK